MVSSSTKRPVQARSIATFAKILDAATKVIVEKGIQGLNTNIVADRAQVNIGTVYHYFPDKTAILVELSKEMQVRSSKLLLPLLVEFETTPDVSLWTRRVLETFLASRLEYPANRNLRRALHSVTELHEMLEDDLATNSRFFAEILRRRYPSLSQARSLAVSSLLFRIATEVLDFAMDSPVGAKAELDECTIMISQYLASLAH